MTLTGIWSEEGKWKYFVILRSKLFQVCWILRSNIISNLLKGTECSTLPVWDPTGRNGDEVYKDHEYRNMLGESNSYPLKTFTEDLLFYTVSTNVMQNGRLSDVSEDNEQTT